MSTRKQMPDGKFHHLKPSCISKVVIIIVFPSGIPALKEYIFYVHQISEEHS